MKLFKFICGVDERIGVFADDADAYERRAEVDPTFRYIAVKIDEIVVPGYTITITPNRPPDSVDFESMDRDQLKAWLDEHQIEYTPQWGDKKLREAAKEWQIN